MENDALVEKQLGSEQHINLILKRIRWGLGTLVNVKNDLKGNWTEI